MTASDLSMDGHNEDNRSRRTPSASLFQLPRGFVGRNEGGGQSRLAIVWFPLYRECAPWPAATGLLSFDEVASRHTNGGQAGYTIQLARPLAATREEEEADISLRDS